VSAQGDIEKEFFSYERFVLNRDVLNNIDNGSLQRRMLERFFDFFMEGLYLMSADKMDKAEANFLTAREAWPEYFGTDFLLALVYEEKGLPEKAASYYSSYLVKLYNFHSGKYRISSPIIRFAAGGSIERYDPARQLIGRRLAIYDINIEDISPADMGAARFKYPFFVFVTLVILLIFIIKSYKGHKKKVYLANAPEGFWRCGFCMEDIPELSDYCHSCGKKRPKTSPGQE